MLLNLTKSVWLLVFFDAAALPQDEDKPRSQCDRDPLVQAFRSNFVIATTVPLDSAS